jgi:hypothetical protein
MTEKQGNTFDYAQGGMLPITTESAAMITSTHTTTAKHWLY